MKFFLKMFIFLLKSNENEIVVYMFYTYNFSIL